MNKMMIFLLSIGSMFLMSCGDDDGGADIPMPTGDEMTFDLAEADVAGISGTATFAEYDDGSTQIVLDLNGTEDGGSHPAHIHSGIALDGGDVAISLTSVDGSTGMSETFITDVSYEDLINYDGYINVHLSSDDIETIVAQGDIGENDLTGDEVVYELAEKDVPGISGIATFMKRVNNETLVELELMNTPEGSHPAHIHMGSVDTAPGAIAISFTPIDGTTGMSWTNISMTDADEAITYDDLLTYDGYINVHSSTDINVLIAQGNMGANAD